LTFVAKIVVLLPQGFRLGIGRRNLLIGGARPASEDKVARRQRQQSADNASLVPAKIMAGNTSQSKRTARTARAGAVIAGRPKNGTGIPSFIFWSASRVRCVPRRSAAIARRVATVPFGINSLPSPRNRAIIRSSSGLLAAR